jgi:hypothetical protein
MEVSVMEIERHDNTRGIAGAGLGLGIAGTALGVLNGGLGGILGNGWGGGWNGNCAPMGVCSESQLVNRYELGQERKIAELQSAIALRDANTYGDQKLLEVYKYIDGELKAIRATLCEQAVTNQRTAGSFALASADLAAVKAELTGKINLEAERRCCADNAIVNYANATFYPKMVADVTVGTTTTAQTLYNPIPDCGGCCGK